MSRLKVVIGGLLFCLAAMAVVASAHADSFDWPIANHNVTNGYASDSYAAPLFHTGINLVSSTGSDEVKAIADGTVVGVYDCGTCPDESSPGIDGDNHHMGNTIIIIHNNSEGPYSLYAHLNDISVTVGQSIDQGQLIGEMGNTGCENLSPSCGKHLHLEIKQWPVLGSVDDHSGPVCKDTILQNCNNWGYSALHPNLHGYINPYPYMELYLPITSEAVSSVASQPVKTGPGDDYDHVVTTVSIEQQFSSFSSHGSWRQIFIPSPTGPASGWIEAENIEAELLQIIDPSKGVIGVSLRQGAGITHSKLDAAVWDGQKFVYHDEEAGDGCTMKWFQIDLSDNASLKNGWVCSEFLNILPPSQGLTPLENDGVVSGSISVSVEQDEFTFDASEGEGIHVRVGKTAGWMDPEIWLYNPNGVLLKYDSGNTSAEINCYSTSSSCQLTQTGLYRVVVGDKNANDTGTYDIHLSQSLQSGIFKALSNNESISNDITMGDLDTYTFQASEGEGIHVRVGKTAGWMDPEIWLYNPNGVLLKYDSGNTSAEINCYSTSSSCQLTETGLYRVVVGDKNANDTGTYDIHLSQSLQSGIFKALSNNESISNDITMGDLDTYTFQASEGEGIHVRVGKTAGWMDPEIWLYNPNGVLLKYDSGNTSAEINCYSTSSSCQLTETGLYRVVVGDKNANDTGTYDIHLSQSLQSGIFKALSNNESISNDITMGDLDTYTFQASEGEGIHVRVGKTAGWMDPEIWLYNPNGVLLKYDSGNTSAEINCYSTSSSCQLTETGLYRVVVGDKNANDTGTYDIHLSQSLQSGIFKALSNNESISNDITMGDLDTYTFQASEGEGIHVRVGKTAGWMDPEIWLYNPNGVLLKYDSGNTSAEINCYSTSSSCQLTETGLYRVVVGDKNANDTGTYDISFDGPIQPDQQTIPAGFRWPIGDGITMPFVTQDYACRGPENSEYQEENRESSGVDPVTKECAKETVFHSGLDLRATSPIAVYAAQGGIIHKICRTINGVNECDTNSLGNVILIAHEGGLYSLYAHLSEDSLRNPVSGLPWNEGEVLDKGVQIALSGNTGSGNVPFHLHFEIKDSGTLLDSDAGNVYTPNYPGDYGYKDPWKHFALTQVSPVPISVVRQDGLKVRRGPGIQYAVFTEIGYNQSFVAFAKYEKNGEVWYRIHLPCMRNNACAGWVAGVSGGFGDGVEDPAETQAEITGTGIGGIRVRTSTDTSSADNVIDKIFDGQRIVTIGTEFSDNVNCVGSWYQVELPIAISGVSSGWVCGSYVSIISAVDTDGDGIADTVDVYPLVAIGELLDTDNDGAPNDCDESCVALGMAADADDDNDGVLDVDDALALDASESLDTDLDGIGNNADNDDDGDGIPDTYELANGLDPLDASDGVLDNDSDGLSNYDEFRIGTDINLADTDGDGINDNIDNNPLVFDEEAPTLYSGQLAVLPDLNDDGIAEIGILKVDSEAGKIQLDVLSGKDQVLLNTVVWTDSFEDSSLTLRVIPDINDNGVAEVGLFGIQDSTNNEGKPQMFVRDLQTGARVSVYNWPANWKEVSAIVLSDISGDGIAEIGIQGRFKDGNRPQMLVKNGANGSSEGTYAYPDLFDAPMFYQHSDVDGDGFEEIATFGVISRNGKIQVKITNGINAGNKMKAYNFPDKWDNVSWHRLDDSNGDGIDDWGLFGISNDDGRPQLINKDGIDPRGALRIYAWPADLSNAQFYRIPDMNNDGVDEVASAGRRSNGRYQFQVQDGVDRNSVLANHNLNLKLENLTFHVLPDLSGDEKAEIGFLGINALGEYELVIQHGNIADGEYARHNLGSDWQNAPDITSLGDTDDDGLPDLLIYGQNASGEQLVITSL